MLYLFPALVEQTPKKTKKENKWELTGPMEIYHKGICEGEILETAAL